MVSFFIQKQHLKLPFQFHLAKLSLVSTTPFSKYHIKTLILSGILSFQIVRVTDKVYPLALNIRCVLIWYTRVYMDSFRIRKGNLSYDRDSVCRWKEFYSDKTGSLPYREGSDISESYLEIN